MEKEDRGKGMVRCKRKKRLIRNEYKRRKKGRKERWPCERNREIYVLGKKLNTEDYGRSKKYQDKNASLEI